MFYNLKINRAIAVYSNNSIPGHICNQGILLPYIWNKGQYADNPKISLIYILRAMLGLRLD